MMPISVLIPVATTIATQAPLEIVVEEKSRLLFSYIALEIPQLDGLSRLGMFSEGHQSDVGP